MHSKYANVSIVACDRVTIIQSGVGVKASISLSQDLISGRLSKTTSKTLHKCVVAQQFGQANNGIFAGNDLALHTTNTENVLEMKR
jgi:hypothetical protein